MKRKKTDTEFRQNETSKIGVKLDYFYCVELIC